MNLNLPGNIVSINDVKERKMKPPIPPDEARRRMTKLPEGPDFPRKKVKAKGEYAISTRKLLLIIFIGLWVIDCLIAAWIIFHTVCG